MKRAKPPNAPSATTKRCRFQRRDGGSWEDGTVYLDGKRVLAIATKRETLLCPPNKIKIK